MANDSVGEGGAGKGGAPKAAASSSRRPPPDIDAKARDVTPPKESEAKKSPGGAAQSTGAAPKPAPADSPSSATAAGTAEISDKKPSKLKAVAPAAIVGAALVGALVYSLSAPHDMHETLTKPEPPPKYLKRDGDASASANPNLLPSKTPAAKTAPADSHGAGTSEASPKDERLKAETGKDETAKSEATREALRPSLEPVEPAPSKADSSETAPSGMAPSATAQEDREPAKQNKSSEKSDNKDAATAPPQSEIVVRPVAPPHPSSDVSAQNSNESPGAGSPPAPAETPSAAPASKTATEPAAPSAVVVVVPPPPFATGGSVAVPLAHPAQPTPQPFNEAELLAAVHAATSAQISATNAKLSTTGEKLTQAEAKIAELSAALERSQNVLADQGARLQTQGAQLLGQNAAMDQMAYSLQASMLKQLENSATEAKRELGLRDERIAALEAKLEAATKQQEAKLETSTKQQDDKIESSTKQFEDRIGASTKQQDGKIEVLTKQLDGKIESSTKPLEEKVAALAKLLEIPKNEQRAQQDRENSPAHSPERKVARAMLAQSVLSDLVSGEPLAEAIAGLGALDIEKDALAPLAVFATEAPPTRTQLAEQWRALRPALDKTAQTLQQTASENQDAQSDKNWYAPLLSKAKSLTKIEPVGERQGDGPSGRLSRIDAALARGDILGALDGAQALPDAMRAQAASWIQTAANLTKARAAAQKIQTESLAALSREAK